VRWEVRIALLQMAMGDERAARRSIHQALIAGAPGRLIRPFVEDTELIVRLLPAPPDARSAQDFQSRFAGEVREAVQKAAGVHVESRQAAPDASVAVDGLSQREVEILRLVATGMLNGEIGNQLGLTEGSVKWYLQRIFDKVGTRRRMLAVDYARRRGLLN
jgi:LuxR family maltose regulon positive regulatory protein